MEANNMAAMREALEMFVNHASCLHHCDIHRFYPETTSCDGVLADEGECPMKPECDAVFKGRAALSAPPRNCDVGTADEQADRFKAFCYANRTPGNECSKECPFNDTSAVCYCQARWTQMPFAPAEGGAE